MPMYEYVCRQCEHAFEELVFGDETIKCPKCEAAKVERQLSVPAKPTASMPMASACKSAGPPCGTGCSRWQS